MTLATNAEDCIHACRDARRIQEFINHISLCVRDIVKAKGYLPGMFYWEGSTARERAYQTVFTKINDPCLSDLTMQCLVLMYVCKDGSFGTRVRIQFQAGSLISHTEFEPTKFDPSKQDVRTLPEKVVSVLRHLYEFDDQAVAFKAEKTAAIAQALDEFEALRIP